MCVWCAFGARLVRSFVARLVRVRCLVCFCVRVCLQRIQECSRNCSFMRIDTCLFEDFVCGVCASVWGVCVGLFVCVLVCVCARARVCACVCVCVLCRWVGGKVGG